MLVLLLINHSKQTGEQFNTEVQIFSYRIALCMKGRYCEDGPTISKSKIKM